MLSDNNDPPPNAMKRLPLTPIPVDGPFPNDDDAKSTTSSSYAAVARSHSDDEFRPSLYQRRKSSVPALTLGKPTYNRRRSHNRRPSPARNSPVISASLTPINPSFNTERRTSLPALHFHETVQNVMPPLHIDTNAPSRRGSISEDIYCGLQSFTFGAPPSHMNNDSDESDEDERLRHDRAKMRAIDDGTRRPSLPTNDCTPQIPRHRQSFSSTTSSAAQSMASSAHIVVGERQYDEHGEADWDIVMGDITPTKSSPPLATPTTTNTTDSASSSNLNEIRRPSLPIPIPALRRRSRSAEELASDLDRIRGTTPTQLSTSTPLFSWAEGHSPDEVRGRSSSPEENALDGFDLNYILSEPAAVAEAGQRLQRQTSSGRLRSKFRSKAANASAIPPRVEDTFMGHLGKFDPVYERRKREWSFRREVITPGHPANSQRTVRPNEVHERWRCELIGTFSVIKMNSNDSTQHSADAPKPVHNRLQITPKPSGLRMVVHRHSRARAFSIFRTPILPKKAMPPHEAVLMAVKSVLKEYTRTESTRALQTHGLIDDDDSRTSHRHHQHGDSRSSTGSHGSISRTSRTQPSRPRSSSSSRAHGAADSAAGTRSEPKKVSPSRPSPPNQPSSSHPPPQVPDVRPRKDSTRTVTSVSPSTSRSGSSSRPPSLGMTRAPVPVEPPTPAQLWDISTGTSPRTSTSHAEAFAMRDLDADIHHHHREGNVPPHVAPLPPPATPSPPHVQSKSLGFSERIKRAFGSSKQQHQPKDLKEPVSPGTEEEDEPKTANQDGMFAPPWITVVRRSEREQHDRMIRTLNSSFESVGLIPPQEKKKPTKTRHKSKGEDCAPFEDVPDDSMCMLLPLWPRDQVQSNTSRTQGLSRTSSRSVGHSASLSTNTTPGSNTIPLQDRKFLLVYYTPFVESPTDDGSGGNNNNKKRRRPQTAGERPNHTHRHRNVGTTGGSSSFAVVARLLGYEDVRSSGVRLPEIGLVVSGSIAAATLAIPSPSEHGMSSQVIAQCHGPENGVELVQEGLEQLGLVDHTAPRGVDVNGDPTGVKLSEVGRAVVEMVWSGCMSLMTFT